MVSLCWHDFMHHKTNNKDVIIFRFIGNCNSELFCFGFCSNSVCVYPSDSFGMVLKMHRRTTTGLL